MCGKRDLVFVWDGGVEFINYSWLMTLIVSSIKFSLWSWWGLCSHGIGSLSHRGVWIYGVLERCGVFSLERPAGSSENALCNREGQLVARVEGEGVF